MNGRFSYKNDYDKYLIKDYTNVITRLANTFPANSNKIYDFYENNALDNIGLKDIYVKFRTAELADYIKKAVKRNDWYIGWSFHNKKGTIDIFKTFENPSFTLGLQIEGNPYRYCLISLEKDASENAGKIREKIANELFCRGYWFNYTKDTKRNKLYKEFCGYNPDFIYKYFTLEKHYAVDSLKDISYDDIIRQIKNDFENIDSNIDIIKEIVSKNL